MLTRGRGMSMLEDEMSDRVNAAMRAAGAEVVLNARNAGALTKAANQIRETTGATVHVRPFDVTDPGSVAIIFKV